MGIIRCRLTAPARGFARHERNVSFRTLEGANDNPFLMGLGDNIAHFAMFLGWNPSC